MNSIKTTETKFKAGDRVVHVQDLVTIKSINADGTVNTDKFYACSPDTFVLYVDPSEKKDCVFQIGDKVRAPQTGQIFVIDQVKYSTPSIVHWYTRFELEHYTNEMELADVDKEIMKLVELRAKLIKEQKNQGSPS